MNVQMKSNHFEPSDYISVRSSIDSLESFCLSNGIHKGGGMGLYKRFMTDPDEPALTHRNGATEEYR